MARVNTYLNFMGNTEEAFNFYKEVFGTEFISLTRMKDMPRPAGAPPLLQSDENKIMNIQLPITNGHILMATDALESMGHKVEVGSNVTISLDLDSAEEAQRIYSQLLINSPESSGPLSEMPWGALWGSCQDQFGIRWMISYAKAN
jgi:PhnB protein